MPLNSYEIESLYQWMRSAEDQTVDQADLMELLEVFNMQAVRDQTMKVTAEITWVIEDEVPAWHDDDDIDDDFGPDERRDYEAAIRYAVSRSVDTMDWSEVDIEVKKKEKV